MDKYKNPGYQPVGERAKKRKRPSNQPRLSVKDYEDLARLNDECQAQEELSGLPNHIETDLPVPELPMNSTPALPASLPFDHLPPREANSSQSNPSSQPGKDSNSHSLETNMLAAWYYAGYYTALYHQQKS